MRGRPTKPPGRVTYTQMLNARGGIECDLTLARLAADRFYLVTGTGFRTHDAAWIRDNIGADFDARLVDVTEERATLAVMGPRARDLLADVSNHDLSNAGFPVRARARRSRSRAGARLRCASRMSANSAGNCIWRMPTRRRFSTP